MKTRKLCSVAMLFACALSFHADAQGLKPICDKKMLTQESTKPDWGHTTIPEGTTVLIENQLGFRHPCKLPQDVYPRNEEVNGQGVAYELRDGLRVFAENREPFTSKLKK